MIATKAWLGAGALTIGIGAAALACSGVASADTAGPAPHHTIAASHSPVKPIAHTAPRPKPTTALIAASTLTGVADHKPTAAIHSVAHLTAGAVPKIVEDLAPLIGAIVHLGSEISKFNVARAIHDLPAAVQNAIHGAAQALTNPAHSIISNIEFTVAEIVGIITLPITLTIDLTLLIYAVKSGLWY